jgi:sentrin-specific protease 1
VFFPINIADSHWVLVIALMQQKCILYRDAMGGNGQKYTSAIMQYLGDEMREKLGVMMTKAECDLWHVQLIPPAESPQQQNGYDCGMFVCMYADYMLQDLPEQFSQQDMPMLRRKICYCVLTGCLLYTV